jgi:hypothetical protein
VTWQDKGIYWGAETNQIKAGLRVRYVANETNQTLVQITPMIHNGSISNDVPSYPIGGQHFGCRHWPAGIKWSYIPAIEFLCPRLRKAKSLAKQ